MSYASIVAGIQTRLNTVTSLVSNLAYAPAAVNDTPMTYILLDGAELTEQSQALTVMYDVTVRLIVRWQDNEQAEAQAMPYVDSIVDAIRGDPTLGAKANYARVTKIEGAWVTIAGVEYRAIDFTVRVKEVRQT